MASRSGEGRRCGTLRTRAFTLIELLLTTVLGAILLSAVAVIFANLASSFAEQPASTLQFDWDADGNADTTDYIPMVPAYSQLPNAFALQAEMMQQLQATDSDGLGTLVNLTDSTSKPVQAVFVVSSWDGCKLPGDNFAPDILQFSVKGLRTNAQFYDSLLAVAGDDMGTDYGYSIFFVSGEKTLNMVVHVRLTFSGSNNFYKVFVYENTGGNMAFVPELSYAYGIPEASDFDYTALSGANGTSRIYPSARTISLLSTQNDWGVYSDLGTQVVLPDPTAYPYQLKSGDSANVRTFSRFSMFLPLNP